MSTQFIIGKLTCKDDHIKKTVLYIKDNKALNMKK